MGKGYIARYEHFLLFSSVFKRLVSKGHQKVSLCGNWLNGVLQYFRHITATGRIFHVFPGPHSEVSCEGQSRLIQSGSDPEPKVTSSTLYHHAMQNLKCFQKYDTVFKQLMLLLFSVLSLLCADSV